MSNKIFDNISIRKPKMSGFDLSREQKLSCRFGQLIPTLLEEVVPGDQFKVKTETLARLAPMLAPVMHRVNLYMHYFFVPNRIIWEEWEDFITGGQEGTTEPVMPTVTLDDTVSADNKKLADYLGIPPQAWTTAGIKVSALPFRVYQQIYKDYYRDPNLGQSWLNNHVSTWSAEAILGLRNRAFEKDYFTSALPWTQRGPAVGVPVDIKYQNATTAYYAGTNIKAEAGKPVNTMGAPTGPNTALGIDPTTGDPTALRLENIETDGLDFSINQLRTSSALQRWLEKQARGGHRYIETLLSHFGVRSSDKRLQRAEYLGGGRQPIVISEVLNTTGTAEAPQGDMTGHGISTGVTNSFSRRFEEHGYVMGILSVLPKTAYSQGIHRTFLRKDKYDYYWPEFADLGEQEIKNIELYASEIPEDNDETFGYQQRYAEYKYGQSTVHGAFRNELEFWHMARKFNSQPVLNTSFVLYPVNNAPDQRAFAVQGEDNLWIQLYHDVKARRPMPYFSNPKLM